jgi:D-alanyl-D-alanine carboxypeptidase
MKKFTLTLATIALGVIVSFAQSSDKMAKKTTTAVKPATAKPATAPAKAAVTAPAVTTPATPSTTQPEFLFETESHDFGTVPEGTQATYEFKFTNTGKEPLIISNVRASCGCTTPKWSNEPIAPGKTGTITASYNSSGRPGPFTKTITVESNAKTTPKVLTINGVVEAKPVEQPSPVVVPETPKN